MNKLMNESLEEIRVALAAQQEAAAWGPDSDAQGDTSGGEPGELGATNASSMWDAFDLYVGDIIDDLTELYELSDDEAMDFIFDLADALAEEGQMPPLPELDDAQEVSAWLGVATSIGFERMVLDDAADAASGA